MTLGKKILLLIGSTTVVLIIALYLSSQFILLNGFARIEERNTETNIQRVMSALDSDLSKLSALAYDWSAWDDTYEFIVDTNEEYIKANLTKTVFVAQRLNAIVFVDTSGKIKFARGYDSVEEKMTPISPELATFLENNDILTTHPDNESHPEGIVLLSAGPILLASCPILTSEAEGPIRGTVIMGRFWNEAEVQHLAETTYMSLQVYPFDSPSMPDDFAIAKAALSEREPFFVHASDDEMITGFAAIPDIYGKPCLLLKVEKPRDIYSQAKGSLNYYLVSMVLIGLIICALTLFLLKTQVIDRLILLTQEIRQIDTTSETDARLTVRGKDELTLVCIVANRMLDNLAASRKELSSNKSRFKALHNATFGGIAIHDKGVILECNRGLSDLTGYSVEELIGMDGLLLIAEHAREMVTRHILSGYEIPYEARGVRKTGEEYPLRLEGRDIPYKGKNARVVEFRDITEKKRGEEERERLMAAIEQAAETIVITDSEGAIQYTNPVFERTTGYTREEAAGQNPRILKSSEHDDAFYKDMWDTLTRGETWSGRIVNKKKNGALYTVEATISPVRDASGKTVNYVAVKHDITHEVELMAQLRQSQKMEAVGQLAGGIAHDFNNLLQAILGYGDMALDDAEADSPVRVSVEEMMKAGNRAKTLVSQLLAFSRRQVLDMKDVNLNDLIADLMKILRRVIGEHITLGAISGHDLETVHADPGQIEQILINLCVNARDAMGESGKITIETENVQIDKSFCMNHAWAKPGRYVMLSVTDTGCGMDKEMLGKVFEPFFTTKEVGKGTGLGLATVYGLVKQHKGMVHVYSEVGKGTTFKVYLPLAERSVAAVDDKIESPVYGGAETILLAEDDEMILNLTRTILEHAGYTVLIARDGEEALRVFEEHADEIDMALLDVIMPKLGGKAAYEHLRKAKPTLRFLFASGYSMHAIHTNFVLDEGLALIQKPSLRNDLLRKIREVLDSSE